MGIGVANVDIAINRMMGVEFISLDIAIKVVLHPINLCST
jgi:hypothetical protein